MRRKSIVTGQELLTKSLKSLPDVMAAANSTPRRSNLNSEEESVISAFVAASHFVILTQNSFLEGAVQQELQVREKNFKNWTEKT